MDFFEFLSRRYVPLSMLSFHVVEDQQPFQNNGNRKIELWMPSDNKPSETIMAAASPLPDRDLLKQVLAARVVSLP